MSRFPWSCAATALSSQSANSTWMLPRFVDTCEAQASSPEEEELIAAKMVGRWRSGAPWCWLRTATIPHWARTEIATMISATRMT